MKILILGSGVIGVTTAYVLAKRGYDVEVIDRAPHAAAETSYANGGQLSYSHAEPWANPGTLPKVFKWMFDDTAPLVMRPRWDLDMFKWGLNFLSNCTTSKAEANTVTMLKLGLYSRKMMQKLHAETNLSFDYKREGILHIFCNEKDFEAAKKQAHFQEKFGCEETFKTRDECLALEPALHHSDYKLVAGIHAHQDESGDIFQFTSQLAALCQSDLGVKFHYNTTITGLVKKNDKIVAVQTDKGEFTADNYVLSLGSYSPLLLKDVGINVPIYPMKGYSITFKSNEYAPKISVTDQKAKIVYSGLGTRLRVAGTAEFAGYDNTLNMKRVDAIKRAVQKLFPKAIEGEDAVLTEWACLRPSTPDGPPIIGKTPLINLYLNTGHGTLGWTQAAGSAYLLADSLEHKPTEISLDGLNLARYL